jgi:hypothetical protein
MALTNINKRMIIYELISLNIGLQHRGVNWLVPNFITYFYISTSAGNVTYNECPELRICFNYAGQENNLCSNSELKGSKQTP